MNMNFDDIRPYDDSEMRQALQRIARSPEFESVAAYVYPSTPLEQVRGQFVAIKTIEELQNTVMYDLIKHIIDTTITQFSFSGVEQLTPGQNYLFVSNHRDIVLDANLLVYVMFLHDFPPIQITFGANLMSHPVVADAGKCNRMFKVERGGNPKEFYTNLRHVSLYMRHVLADRHESVWIAQRNGRTKDGDDHTEVALVKMLGLYDSKPTAETYSSLRIVPVTISYEWEPCDFLKVREVCLTRKQGGYTKQPGEDLVSILTGIRSPKGQVHISFNKPIDAEDLRSLPGGGSALAEQLAQLLTRRIREGYRLMPTNYVAYDLLHGGTRYAYHYTPAQKQCFLDRLSQVQATDGLDVETLRQQFLTLYANPVGSLSAIRQPITT